MNANELALKANSYPGRGIIIGMSADAKSLVEVYWIMGRSENSRNRIFVADEFGVKTEAFDPAKMTDPSLIIYYPVRTVGDAHIITNGNQTDTIAEYLEAGKTFEEALLTRQFEPDQPNCTPRISGVIYADKKSFALSILKTVANDDSVQKKEFYTFDDFTAGEGRCIHTYMGDGTPLPSFDVHPYAVELGSSAEENVEKFWALLNEENRVSLLAKHIDVATGEVTLKIVNRFVK